LEENKEYPSYQIYHEIPTYIQLQPTHSSFEKVQYPIEKNEVYKKIKTKVASTDFKESSSKVARKSILANSSSTDTKNWKLKGI
jgi:hypothetical protein